MAAITLAFILLFSAFERQLGVSGALISQEKQLVQATPTTPDVFRTEPGGPFAGEKTSRGTRPSDLSAILTPMNLLHRCDGNWCFSVPRADEPGPS